MAKESKYGTENKDTYPDYVPPGEKPLSTGISASTESSSQLFMALEERAKELLFLGLREANRVGHDVLVSCKINLHISTSIFLNDME